MKKHLLKTILFVSFLFSSSSYAEERLPAITQSIEPGDITNFQNLSTANQKLIINALTLTKKDLTYLYGSADPKNGGMDCSGTIYFLLESIGVNSPPRDSQSLYQLAVKNQHFHTVTTDDLNSPQLSQLKPGDLLFWSGTYQAQNSAYATHVMLYLGTNKQGKPLMFGSSDGRPFAGKSMRGVSVFDFELPTPSSKAKFIGYSCIDNYNC